MIRDGATVAVWPGEPIALALRRLDRQVLRAGVLAELNRRRRAPSPAARRRAKAARARKRLRQRLARAGE